MEGIDRAKLSSYLEQQIDHQTNPQSFRYQMQTEIQKCLKSHQRQLKHARSKMRFQNIIEQQTRQREQLKRQIQDKAKKGIQHKNKLLEDRTKSLVDLHRRRQQLKNERLKQSRKEQLLKSLKKIKQFQNQREAAQQFRLNKSASQVTSRSSSKLIIRQQAQNAEYEVLVTKLSSKGLFTFPTKQLNDLYSQRARNMKIIAEKQEKTREDKIGESLSRIEEARQRKENLLLQRSKRLQNQERYQFQLNRSKSKELQAEQRKKKKLLQTQQAKKVLKGKSVQLGQQSYSRLGSQGQQVEVELGEERITVKNPSYRQQIRKHIEEYLIGKKS